MAFISPSVSIARAVSAVLSTNSAWPVRLVWMSFSVSDRHGFPHATHCRFSTASVDSAKSAWPVASPWLCASATDLVRAAHVALQRERRHPDEGERCFENGDASEERGT